MAGRDEANTMILLEVIVAAAVILAYMVPMILEADPPPVHDTDQKWRELQARGENVLIVLDNLSPMNLSTQELERQWGRTYLERLIALRYANPVDAKYQWEHDLDWTFEDPGTFRQLSIGTSPHYRTLFGEKYGEPRGERVTAKRHVDAKWNAVHTAPVADPLDGVTPATFLSAWVNASKLARQPGEAIRINATIGDLLDTHRQMQAYGLVGQSGTRTLATITLSWATLVGADTQEGAATAVVGPSSAGSTQSSELRITCQPPSIAATNLPADVLLTIHTEPGLGALAHRASAGWSAHGPARVLPDGRGELTFIHDADQPCDGATESSVTFAATLSPTAPALVRVHAFLHEGAMARSTAVLQYTGGAPGPTMPRELLLTLPYAVQPGATARVGALLVNGAEPTSVTNVTLSIPGGYDFKESDGQGADLFASLSRALQPVGLGERACRDGAPAGWKRVSARVISWCGELDVPAYGVVPFAVDVTFQSSVRTRHGQSWSGTGYASGELGYWNQSLTFPNGHTAFPVDGPGAWQRSPGVARFRVPAASIGDWDSGYPTVATGGGTLGVNDDVYARLRRSPYPEQAGPHAPGATFHLATSVPGLAGLEGAVLNSTVAARERVARAGATTVVDVDFSNVMREIQGASAIVNLQRYIEVYGPASPEGAPFLRIASDVSASPPLPVRHLASGNLVGADAHEVVASAADGFAYALSAQAVDGAPPVWSAKATSSGNGEALASLVADVTTLSAGGEAVTASLNGDVATFAGATGARVWMHERLFDRAYDLAHDRASARVIAAGRDPATKLLSIAWLHPDTGATTATYALPNSAGVGGVITPFGGATPLDRRVALACASGRVVALSTSGTLLWSWSATDPAGGVLDIASGDYDANPLNGDELAVVFGHRIVLLSGAGALVREWVAPSNGASGLLLGVAASASASTTGTAGPEVAWAGEDDRIRFLDMGTPGMLLWTVDAPSASSVGAALPEAGWLQEWEVGAPACSTEDLGNSLTCLIADPPQTPALPGNPALPITRITTLSILKTPASIR